MWNPFRRETDPKPFPEPKWPPIQELDSIDITGARKDGGVDLVIVASQPIDDSADTLAAIRHKVQTYLAVIDLPEFQAEMGHPPRDKVAIVLTCEHPIHPSADAVIQECRSSAAAQGVQLEVRKSLS